MFTNATKVPFNDSMHGLFAKYGIGILILRENKNNSDELYPHLWKGGLNDDSKVLRYDILTNDSCFYSHAIIL